jgi:hypothetical protein
MARHLVESEFEVIPSDGAVKVIPTSSHYTFSRLSNRSDIAEFWSPVAGPSHTTCQQQQLHRPRNSIHGIPPGLRSRKAGLVRMTPVSRDGAAFRRPGTVIEHAENPLSAGWLRSAAQTRRRG